MLLTAEHFVVIFKLYTSEFEQLFKKNLTILPLQCLKRVHGLGDLQEVCVGGQTIIFKNFMTNYDFGN